MPIYKDYLCQNGSRKQISNPTKWLLLQTYYFVRINASNEQKIDGTSKMNSLNGIPRHPTLLK
jgi:hypothetical protein